MLLRQWPSHARNLWPRALSDSVANQPMLSLRRHIDELGWTASPPCSKTWHLRRMAVRSRASTAFRLVWSDLAFSRSWWGSFLWAMVLYCWYRVKVNRISRGKSRRPGGEVGCAGWEPVPQLIPLQSHPIRVRSGISTVQDERQLRRDCCMRERIRRLEKLTGGVRASGVGN